MLVDTSVGSAVRFLIAMELGNGTNTGRNMGQFGVSLDFGKVASMGALGNNEAEQQKGEISIWLHAPVFTELACA